MAKAIATAAAVVFALAATAAQAQEPARFKVSVEGHDVLDTKTNLLWRRCVEGMKWNGTQCTGKAVKLSLSKAKQQTLAATQADNKAWRIPTKDELKQLVIKAPKKPLIDAQAFPNTPAAPYWALREGYDDNLNAWLIDFGNGRTYGGAGSKHNLRLVRNN